MHSSSDRRVWRIIYSGSEGGREATETYGSLHEARIARARLTEEFSGVAAVLAIVSEEAPQC
jgi:hypothetical protein